MWITTPEPALLFDLPHILGVAVVGLIAGVLGGLAGVGGSMVMLPALHFLYGDEPESIHHLYMAAAMTVNVMVSLPAALRHHRARAVRTDLVRVLAIGTTVAVIAGVLLGNLVAGDRLRLCLALFLGVYCLSNLVRLVRNHPEHAAEDERTDAPRLAISGVSTGLIGGLLGLGGGVVLVPMLQFLNRVPLRNAIATSSAVICITAVFGAGLKLASLSRLGQSPGTALALALAMAPTAVIGGTLGARLTHTLPIRSVRIVITALMLVVAARLADLPELFR
ncbi:MAG: sulfite exporter TauE/SafE family protein [Phycisphaerales bacterium]|nr:sulfite exporter TauE/SafE family protein [Phycisphaerales bacterium]